MKSTPLPSDEATRLKAAGEYEEMLLSSPSSHGFDDCVRVAAHVCDAPIAYMSLITADEQWIYTALGTDRDRMPRQWAVCAHTILTDEILMVPDAALDERFRDHPFVTGPPGIRSYAGVPLVAPGGERVGTICIMDRKPRVLSSGQRDTLERLARQIVNLLEMIRESRRLAKERAALEQAIEVAAVAPWSMDPDTRVYTFNDALYSICGTTAEREGGYEMSVEAYLREFVHPDDLPAVVRRIEEGDGASDGYQGQFEHRLIRRDGEVRDISVSVRVVKDQNGRTLAVFGANHDVTERKAAGKSIQAQNLRLEGMVQSRTASLLQEQRLNRVLLESLAEGVVACDAEGRLVLFNRAARDWHGADPRAIPQEEWADHYDLFEADGVTPLRTDRIPLVRAFRGEHVRNAGMSIAAKGRPVRYVLASGDPLHGPGGEKLGAVVVMHDITERQAAERAIEEKHRQLVAAEAAGGIGSFEFDVEADHLTISDELYRIYGVDRGSFDPTLDAFLDQHHPEDRERVAAIVARSIETGEGFEVDRRIVRPDGSVRTLMTRGQVVPAEEGRPLRVVGICQDVTDRVLRERERDMGFAMLDATRDGAFVFAPDSLRFDYVNQGAAQQLGYTREELLTMTPLDISPDFDERALRELLESARTGPAGTRQISTVHRTRSGSDIPVEIVLQHVVANDGQSRFIASVRDVTERLENERRLRQTQRMESIGTLAGGIAHDLNNALAPILMGTELLRAEYESESELLDVFETSARRAADMVRQLLTFAKGAEGERVSVQPAHLVHEMQSIIRGSFPKNITVQWVGERDLPTVSGDSTQIHQVLLNLCVNARDAMPRGGKLTIGSEAVDIDATFAATSSNAAPGRYVCLWVQDTGVGMPEDLVERIFDPFFTTKDADQGTGLGLSTTLGIVKGHGGFVDVSSTPGEGSTFRVYLPAEDALLEDVAPAGPSADLLGAGETVLVVDDEYDIRVTARTVLESLNYEVLTATDGADGLIQAVEHRRRIQAVLTDLHMPEMDGLAFVKLLRRMMPDVRVLAMSGQLPEETVDELAELGVSHRIAKPFSQHHLASSLASLLRTPG